MKLNLKNTLTQFYIVMMTIVMFTRQFDLLKNWSSIFNVIEVCALILGLVVMISNQYSIKEIQILGIVLFYFVIIFFINGQQHTYLILNILTLAILKSFNPNKFIILIRNTYGVIFTVLFSLLALGIIDNTSIYKGTSDGIWVLCTSYGFAHPNTFYWVFFVFIASYVFTRFNNMTLIESILIVLSSYYLYTTTNSRTGFFTTVILICMRFLFVYFETLTSKFISLILKYLHVVFYIISLLLVIVSSSSNGIVAKINYWTTGRFILIQAYYNQYGLSLFGKNLKFDTFDNMYSFVILSFGLVTALLLSLLYIKIIKVMIKQNMKAELCVIIIFSIYSLFESQFTNIFYNFPLVFFCYLIFNKKVI